VPHRQPAGTAAAVAAASHHHQEGLLACRQGRTAAAIALFERALAILPEFAEAHNNLGVLLHAGGDPTGAARHFERALSLNPGYAEAHNNLGAVFQGQGRVPEATLEFERAVAASPAYPDALNNLAMALFAQDRFEAAITRWQQVLALAPDHHGAEVCIGKALYGLFLADADAARRLARRVLADHPASPVIRHAAAGIIGEVTPDRAETGYITALFDFFAPNFDDALGRLSYSPGTLVALLARGRTFLMPAAAPVLPRVSCVRWPGSCPAATCHGKCSNGPGPPVTTTGWSRPSWSASSRPIPKASTWWSPPTC